MHLSAETYNIQQAFSRYCLTGKNRRITGVQPDRLSWYREMVFNILTEALEAAFPIAYANLPQRKWDSMTQDFCSHHACKSYQLWKMPLEFYTYAVEHSWDEKYDIPYLNDLLSFEWAELELYNMEDLPTPAFVPQGNWLHDVILLNPEYRLLAFKYPVQKETTRRKLLQQVGAWFVLLYRIPVTGQVQFVELSPWLAFVAEQLYAGITLSDILEYAPQLNITVTDTLASDTITFLREMQTRQLVLGFQP
ncbi:MAG: putative DNA-binding domain-containing protein [Chitinophaga sp.]|uniref:HvfC/BufC N-terminal domain-containing protein n=1 Tax=Chitinophaga sp. TaxID=1869181 RepID=UPI0025B99E6A|nr:DNA-binding domain-containing protein [Chitinophaga sp.]MBV8253293.1 putative DNA-binding domain-containing protein [Chitinophaga sp.]